MEKERWDKAKKAAMEGRIDDIDGDIFVRHYGNLKKIQKDYMTKPADAEDVTGIWIWGAAGVGKSRKAREEYTNLYDKMCNKWWDGYQGEENVLIDDLDKKHKVLGHHIKRWCDRYSFLGEVKGGAIQIRPKKIIITSQYPIEDIWDDEPETVEAVKRRCQVIYLE